MSGALLPVIRALSFTNDNTGDLERITDEEWRRLLPLTDRSQLTLPLGVRRLGYVPEWVRERIQRDLANNAIRQKRIAETYETVSSALASRGIEFAVLKGFSHCPFYCDDLRYRPQYDLDLYCPPDAIQPAYEAILGLGYKPFGRTGRTAIDHLPPLIRKTGWRSRGDYYDPDIPITIELHFRFWDRETERFNVAGADGFWDRRQIHTAGSIHVPSLHPVDGISYATWHLVRHLVRGDARAYHVYELAHFLQRTSTHDEFWRDWRDARPSPLIETIAFRLAKEWFGCQMNPVVEGLLQALPPQIERWFDLFAFSPILALEQPNKDELFLHFCLVNGLKDRLQIARRRLFPRRLNPYIADVHVPDPDLRLRLKRRIVGAGFLVTRSVHHARSWVPLLRNGLRWRLTLANLQPRKASRTLPFETAPR